MNTLISPSAYPPRSTLLLLVLLAASSNPLLAGPGIRIAAREDAEVAEAKATRRSATGRAAREATIPAATITWTRTEPATTPVDTAGSVLWRNKGVAALGVGGYLAVTQPGQVMDGLAEIIHGPVPPSVAGTSTEGTGKAAAAQFTSATVIGWLVQTVGPFALIFIAGGITLPLLRYIFRPRNR